MSGQERSIQGPAGRLLIVDDVDVNRDLLARRVTRLGHTVDEADDGEGALTKLAAAADSGQPYDVVFLDVMMPGLSGYDVLERIMTNDTLSHTRVIMVSAVDEIDSVVRCIDLGADDYLTKPFNPVLLEARLTSSLARKQVADAQRFHADAMEHELEVGREIQAGFFPTDMPTPDRWHVTAHFQSARQVAGDFYDVFELPNDKLAVVVGDVCDKGVGAALYMALFRTLLRSRAIDAAQVIADDTTLAEGSAVLKAAVSYTNDYIAVTHGDANMFATVFFGIIDLRRGSIEYVNAGHDPALIRHADGDLDELAATGPALGLLPAGVFGIETAELASGDALFIYTDGITDAVSTAGTHFGEDALRVCVREAATPLGVVDAVAGALQIHLDGVPALDDVTMVSVCRL